jgi:hypothetical protein
VQALDVEVAARASHFDPETLAALSDDELDTVIALLAKAGVEARAV